MAARVLLIQKMMQVQVGLVAVLMVMILLVILAVLLHHLVKGVLVVMARLVLRLEVAAVVAQEQSASMVHQAEMVVMQFQPVFQA